ncbi:MAG: type IX secretion system outer membrane channel protein PorV [Bacteroidales bacterium]|jgi:hypothetical protein|nr:type IX secretion system outer membrane channel protein PorV [Bacteroidales bacterium]
MHFRLHKITFAFIFLILGNSLLAQRNVDDVNKFSGGSIATSVPFLIISPDARAGAMGDAGVASTPDINSQHWNAAKYAFIQDNLGFAITYSPWLRTLVSDMNLSYATGFWRFDEDNVLAGSLRYFSLGTVLFTTSADETGQPYKPNEFAFDMSFSRKLTENLSMAITGRYIRSDLTVGFMGAGAAGKSSAANSGAADISMFYTRELPIQKAESSSFAVGLNISNIGAKVSYSETMEKDFLPANLRLGGSYTVQLDRYNQLSVMLDFNKLLVPTPPVYSTEVTDSIVKGMDPRVGVMQGIFQSLHDAPGDFAEELHEINISFGAEYWYNNIFAFRGGYFHESGGVLQDNGDRLYNKGGRQYFTVGAAVKFNMLEVEMSYLLPRGTNANNPLKNTVRFTLKMNLSNKGTNTSIKVDE